MRELLAGGTVVVLSLLLFGCVGQQEPSPETAIGDREIGITEDEKDEPLYIEEDVIEPPEVPEESSTELSLSDIDVFEESDFDIMVTEDIIEEP